MPAPEPNAVTGVVLVYGAADPAHRLLIVEHLAERTDPVAAEALATIRRTWPHDPEDTR